MFRCALLADAQRVAASGESEILDNRPVESLVPDLTAQPVIEDMENTKKLEGVGTKQPCGRVVGIIRRHWREKQYCGSLRVEGDRAVTSGKGQATSTLFMPVDRKVRRTVCVLPPISTVSLPETTMSWCSRLCTDLVDFVFVAFLACPRLVYCFRRFRGCAFKLASEMF